MCLVIKSGTGLRTAKTYLLLYKCLTNVDGAYKTPHRLMELKFKEIGAVSSAILTAKFGRIFNSVYDGIHGFFDAEKAVNFLLYRTHYGVEIHYALIPPGTKYYIGDSGDVVAEKMIIFKDSRDLNNFTCTLEFGMVQKLSEVLK